MEATLITSDANERVKRWRKLAAQPRAIRKEGACLAEGLHLAMSARDAGLAPAAVLLRDGPRDPESERLARQLLALAADQGRRSKAYLLSPAVYESIAPVENGAGIMLEIPVPEPRDPARFAGEDVLYLDGVQDAGNAGTLIRTAVASGVRVIAASPRTACLWSPKVLRSAMGAHFGAEIIENLPADEMARLFRGRKLAADARGGRDIYLTEGWEKGSTVWLMGAEGPGLSDAALEAADMRLYIPIESATESLNVGAAAAVCLFEQKRRRLLASAARRKESK